MAEGVFAKLRSAIGRAAAPRIDSQGVDPGPGDTRRPAHSAAAHIVDSRPLVLELNATKAYGSRTVLRDVHLAMRRGETVAILGANGSGKSTLLRMAATLARPTQGTLTVCGVDAARQGEQARSHLGVLTQAAPVDDEALVSEQLVWALRLRGESALASPGSIEQALASAGLAHAATRRAAELSRGQRQRLALLLALAHDPDVAILDEPFTGLDDQGAAWLTQLLERRRRSRTTLLALHDAGQAARLADRVLTVRAGALVAVASPDETPAAATPRLGGRG